MIESFEVDVSEARWRHSLLSEVRSMVGSRSVAECDEDT